MSRELRPMALLPWLPLSEEVGIGEVVFWPYEKLKGRRLPDRYPVEQVDKYARVFYSTNGKPAKVSCVSYPVTADSRLSSRQLEEIRRARYALFATAYAGGLRWPDLDGVDQLCPSADHFMAYDLPDAKSMAQGVWGFRYPRASSVGVIGDGWRLDEPQHLHRFRVQPFRPLLEALQAAMSRGDQEKMPYVWRALEWFFYAQSTQEHFTEEARLIQLCIAIESAICGTPTGNGTKAFVEKVGNATAELKLPKRHVCYVDRKTKQETRGTVLQKWAYDLYLLRNTLVHCDTRKRTRVVWDVLPYKTYHHFIASYVWFECLWKTLSDIGIIPSRPVNGVDIKTLARWHWTWQCPINEMREWWKAFLSGQVKPLE